MTFKKPDYKTFSCLQSCIEAIKIGGNKPAVVNGANEVAVNLFLENKISFLKIGELVNQALTDVEFKEVNSIDDIIDADKTAREFVLSKI